MAMRGLEGVGDPALGEWCEEGNNGIFHVRRRLSAAECADGGGLVMRDIRGTPEEAKRLQVVVREFPALRQFLRAP